MGCCTREPEDPNEALKGPINKRECRDVIWFLVFIIFWAGMFIIAGFAFENGNYKRLLYGTDSFGMYLHLVVLLKVNLLRQHLRREERPD
jgi:hypothetical protein